MIQIKDRLADREISSLYNPQAELSVMGGKANKPYICARCWIIVALHTPIFHGQHVTLCVHDHRVNIICRTTTQPLLSHGKGMHTLFISSSFSFSSNPFIL